MCGIFRKIMIQMLGAQAENVDTVETRFTNQMDFVVVWYSNHSAIWTSDLFNFQGITVQVSHA
jgi:hypothetical protein